MEVMRAVQSAASILHKGRKAPLDTILIESDHQLAQILQSPNLVLSPRFSTNLKPLSSFYLNENEKFIELKKRLEAFYVEQRHRKNYLHLSQSIQWKKVLYISLHRLLYECTLTRSRPRQLEYLDKIHTWYATRTGRNTLVEGNGRSAQVPLFDSTTNSKARPATAPTKKSLWFQLKTTPLSNELCLAYTGQGDTGPQQREVSYTHSYLSYKPQSENYEEELEKVYQKHREKKLIDTRVQGDMKNMVTYWSAQKSKIIEENTRKSERNQMNSAAGQRRILSRPSTAAFSNAKIIVNLAKPSAQTDWKSETEFLLKQNRIQMLRKINSQYLEEPSREEDDADELKNSLSGFAENKGKLERPKTAGALKFKERIDRNDQIKELYDIKRSMAKRDMLCSITTLKYALITPEDLPSGQFNASCLPQAGAGLISNPLLFKEPANKRKKKQRK